MFLKLLVVLILKNYFGSLIGLAVEKAGKKKGAPELSTEGNSLKTIRRLLESTNGLTGECKLISRKLILISGKPNLTSSTILMMKLSLRNSKRLPLMKEWEE